MLEILNFARGPVAAQHDLLVVLVQGIESMKEFLLNPLLAREKLDIINQQDISLAIFSPETNELIILNGVDVFVREFFGRKVSDLRSFFVIYHILPNRVQQVGL